MKKKLGNYQQAETEGKSQLELVVKIFDGALQSLGSAETAYRNEDFQAGYKDLEKVRRFVVHLYSTLDFVKGGEIADQLGKLYVYMMSEIDLIEATKDIAKLRSCTTVLKNLRDGWAGLRPAPMPIPSMTDEKDHAEVSLMVTA